MRKQFISLIYRRIIVRFELSVSYFLSRLINKQNLERFEIRISISTAQMDLIKY